MLFTGRILRNTLGRRVYIVKTASDGVGNSFTLQIMNAKTAMQLCGQFGSIPNLFWFRINTTHVATLGGLLLLAELAAHFERFRKGS